MAKTLIGYSSAGNPLYEYESYDDPEYKTDLTKGGKDFQYQPDKTLGEMPDLNAQLEAIKRGGTNAIMTNAATLGGEQAAQPKQKMSWAGFGENAVRDVTQLGQGLAAAPFTIGKIVTERPWELLPLAGQVGKGIVQSYANLLTNPVETIYNRPVSSALDIYSVVAPAIKFAKTIRAANAAKAVKETASISDDIAREAGKMGLNLTDDNIDEIAKAAKIASGKPDAVWRFLNQSTDDITGKAFREAPKNVDTAARIYANAWFTIPRAKAQMMKPVEVAKWMLRYGQKGSLDDMAKMSQVVSGSDGFVTQLTRDALGQIDDTVDISNATKAVNNIASMTVGVTPDDANKITRMIAMKTPAGPTGQLDDMGRWVYQGGDISKINAIDAYDLVKQLQKQWAFWHGKAISPVAGPNPNYENIAKLYKAASDEIVTSLDDAVRASGKDIIQGLKTTDNVAKFARISPNFARDFLSVKDWTELRRLSAPFVKAGILSEWTTAQGLSVFAKAGINVGTRLMGGAGGYMLGGLPAMVGGMLVGPVIEPLIERIATSSAPRMAAAFANKLAQIEPALRYTAGPAGVAFREAGRNIFARQIPNITQYDINNQNPTRSGTQGELPPELEAFERNYYGPNK